MIIKLVSILIISLMQVPSLATNNDDLKKILKNDLLEERKLHQKNVSGVVKKKEGKSSKSSSLIDQKNIEDIIFDLWLIRNSKVLKWDIKLPDYGINDVFENTLKSYGLKGIRYRIIFVNSNVITHDVLNINGEELTFLISKVMAEQLDLTKQEICMLLLEAYIRGSLMRSEFENNEFVFEGDKDLKKSINNYVKSRISSLDKRLFDYRSSFETEQKVLKRVYANLSNNTSLISTYKRLQEKINESLKEDVRFKFYAIKYPSPEIKLQWLEGMNVR